jgi:hypothetical protein
MTDVSVVRSTIQGRLDFLQRQLFAINQAWAAAKARGDNQEALDGLRRTYDSVLRQINALKGEALDADMPSGFMLTLAKIGDEAIAVGETIGAVAGTALNVLKYLPWIALGLIIVVGLIYAGKLGKELRK